MTYYTFEKNELKDILYIIVVVSLMFSIMCARFSSFSFIGALISFLIFFTFLLFSRQMFMKFIAYKIGFSIVLHQTHFSKWGFKKYENIKAYTRDKSYSSTNQALDIAASAVIDKENLPYFTKRSKHAIKGIPSLVLSSCLYIITLGLVIYPAVWRYKISVITHKFIGTKHRFENKVTRNKFISDVRVTKALFMGYVFYFIFGILLKLFLPTSGITLWFYFALFWVAFTTLIPLIGTEGYELYMRNRFAYVSAITVLALGMLSLFVFTSILSILLISLPIIMIVIATIYYKKFLFAS